MSDFIEKLKQNMSKQP